MSHYVTLVLTNRAVTMENAENVVGEIIEKYSENHDVEEYQRECFCIGSVARRDARKIADAAVGTIESLRHSFKSIEDDEETEQERWKKHIEPYVTAEKAALESHPLKDAPDAECGDCKGTGTYPSTYNPNSKWDWFSIGGRWQGFLTPGYDPSSDPRNIEPCDICGGTGRRNDGVAMANPGQMEKCHGCNGCDGKGKRLKWPTEWVDSGGNIQPVKNILALNDAQIDRLIPFAFVTPDGEWLKRGDMGWWGIVSDEKPRESWQKEARSIFEKYKDCTAIVVDCHI